MKPGSKKGERRESKFSRGRLKQDKRAAAVHCSRDKQLETMRFVTYL
jgi:hypothetical protein